MVDGTLRCLIGGTLMAIMGLGCGGENSASKKGAEPSRGAALPRVVAEYQGRKITLAEVDASAGEELFRLRADALNVLLAEDLLPREAKRRGVSEQQLLEQEVTAKIVTPSEKELQELYEQAERRGELKPGASFEQFREQMMGVAQHHGAANRREEFLHELMRGEGVKTDPDALGIRRLKLGDLSGSPSRGAPDAPVTIVEFTDFTSAFCAQANATLRELLEKSGKYVRLVFRQHPTQDATAQQAARAAICANEQHKYWEFRQQLFANQKQLSSESLSDHASAVGLNKTAFDSCLRSESSAAQVAKDVAQAKSLDLDGSPEFLVDGIRLSGAHPLATFTRVVDIERNRIQH